MVRWGGMGGENACPSEEKLGNVPTGLQGDSLTWLANLKVPIGTWNLAVIDSLILLRRMWHERKDR